MAPYRLPRGRGTADTRLYGQAPNNDYEETRFRTNAEALEAFIDSYHRIDLAGLEVTAGEPDSVKLTFSGVEISVRPEFVLNGTYRQCQVTGALKLYFSKDHRLDEISSPYITAVVCRYVADRLTLDGSTTRNQSCLVYDVFAGETYAAPAAVTRRFEDIEIACQEIALWWPVV